MTAIPDGSSTSRPTWARLLFAVTLGMLVGAATFVGVTVLVLSAPLSDVNYRTYRSMESTAIPVGEGQLFWTTLNFLPGALWLAVVTTLGVQIALWWWHRRFDGATLLARLTVTAAWLSAVGFVVWSVPMGYTKPGRGPGPMVAWATREIGWSFGFTGLVFAVLAAALAPPACLAVATIRRRRSAVG
jgi:hypothetical protein